MGAKFSSLAAECGAKSFSARARPLLNNRRGGSTSKASQGAAQHAETHHSAEDHRDDKENEPKQIHNNAHLVKDMAQHSPRKLSQNCPISADWNFLQVICQLAKQNPLQLKAIVDQIGVSINFQAIDLFSKNALPHLNLQQDNSNLATLVECLAIVVYVYLHIEPGQNSIKSFLDPHIDSKLSYTQIHGKILNFVQSFEKFNLSIIPGALVLLDKVLVKANLKFNLESWEKTVYTCIVVAAKTISDNHAGASTLFKSYSAENIQLCHLETHFLLIFAGKVLILPCELDRAFESLGQMCLIFRLNEELPFLLSSISESKYYNNSAAPAINFSKFAHIPITQAKIPAIHQQKHHHSPLCQ